MQNSPAPSRSSSASSSPWALVIQLDMPYSVTIGSQVITAKGGRISVEFADRRTAEGALSVLQVSVQPVTGDGKPFIQGEVLR